MVTGGVNVNNDCQRKYMKYMKRMKSYTSKYEVYEVYFMYEIYEIYEIYGKLERKNGFINHLGAAGRP